MQWETTKTLVEGSTHLLGLMKGGLRLKSRDQMEILLRRDNELPARGVT